YTTSAAGTGYWFLQLLDRVSPSQWAAIGVLGSLLLGRWTILLTLISKIVGAGVRRPGGRYLKNPKYETVWEGKRKF
ncbi:phage holin, partial [Escherichia coli]|uniref:phage holin n=1 Tax=Escherichia coli TaxID=562 RepID=UPI003EBA9B46